MTRLIKTALLFVFCLMLMMPLISLAQTRNVQGTVKTPQGEPIPGASIQQRNTRQTTMANENGNFTIAISGANAVLDISAINYIPVEVNVGAGDNFDVVLQVAEASSMEEIVVTAFGIQREKRSLGYSTQEVKAEDLMIGQQPNMVNALQGKVAGVQINSGGGAPGQGATILIRGIKSLDPGKSNQPLFVIDGVIMDNSSSIAGNLAELRGMSNRAADINPDDIETISVLKGGAATALYGQAGSNGVVVITTKSGKIGKIKVDITTSYGVDKINKLPEVQSMYTQGNNYVYDSASFWPTLGPLVADAIAIDPSHPSQLYNHFGQGYQTGNQFRTTLGVNGGSETARLSSSVSYFKQNGMIPYSDYKNISIRLAGLFKLSEKLSFRPSVFYITSGGRRVNANRYNESLSYWSPRWNVMDFIKPDGTMKSYGTQNNPVYLNFAAPFSDEVNRVLGDLSVTYSPFSFLDIDYKMGMDQYTDTRDNTAAGPLGIAGEKRHGDMGLGFVRRYIVNNRIINSNLMATLKKDWIENKLSTTLRLGTDTRDQYFKRVNAEGSELDVPTLLSLNNTKVRTNSETEQRYRIVSAFGEFTAGWDNKIFASITGRNDWSSALTRGLNSYFYPSYSLSAIVSDMVQLPSWISFAKLRGSLAEIGKDTDPYRNNTYYSSYVLTSTAQVLWTRGNQSGDPALKPERTSTLELGTDLRFIKNRLGIDFTWYKLNSRDQIIPVLITPASGFTSVVANAGEIENKGIEITVNAQPIRKTDFSWDIDVNYTANRNKVVSIREDLTEIVVSSLSGYLGSTVTMKYIPGRPVGDLYGTSYLRYYGSGVTDDGVSVYRDLPIVIGNSGSSSGFPLRDLTQRVVGNSQPKWIGGLTNTFRYKDVTLSFLFDAQQGMMKYNQLANFMSAFSIAKYTENRDQFTVFDGVHADGSPNTQSVYLGQGTKDGRNYGDGYYRLVHRGVSENFVEDASWIRLRTLTVGYNIPRGWFERTFIEGARVSFTGNNLWLNTKYTGFDPESSAFNADSNAASGFAGFTYPAARTFLFSLNINFK